MSEFHDYFQALELRKKGLTYREIGEHLRYPSGTIAGWCQRGDVPREVQKYLKIMNGEVLRKCRSCGFTARSLDELDLFVKDKSYKYGRNNLCKECFNAQYRKGGKYWDTTKLSNDRNNKIWNPINNPKRIAFKEKRILLKENPRTNICSVCGKKYPNELKVQTNVHHIEYDPVDPLANTTELCVSCHFSLHRHEDPQPFLANKVLVCPRHGPVREIWEESV